MAAKKKEDKPEIHMCYLCGKEISCDEPQKFVLTKRKSWLYMHTQCVQKTKKKF